LEASGATGGKTGPVVGGGGGVFCTAAAVWGTETGFGRGSGVAAPRPCGTEAGGRKIELSNGLPRRMRADAAGAQAANARTAQSTATVFINRLPDGPASLN